MQASKIHLWVKAHLEARIRGLTRIKKYDFTQNLAFGRHLEEIHTLWTQFGKKRDKIATLLQ
ncbi:hypothetical protein Tco_1308400, partial [Tanacetum coccineum]